MNETKDLSHFLGRNLSYDKDKEEVYLRLRKDPLSPFQGNTMATIFLYAAVLGFKRGVRRELAKPIPNISVEALSSDQISLLLSIPIVMDDIDTLFDPEGANRTINEYANGGIGMIEDELVASPHEDPSHKLSKFMRDLLAGAS